MHSGVRLLSIEMNIRSERTGDIPEIYQLNSKAFDRNCEAKLVNVLRDRGELAISLVALRDEIIVGHVAASPIKVDGTEVAIVGIGPLAVMESHRKQGIGASLMEAAIKELKNSCITAAVLLGNPEYYVRFGFLTASNFKLGNEYNATDAFMAMELQPKALAAISGVVQYSPAFSLCDS